MKPEETSASIDVISEDLKEPAKISVSWKKTDSSFEGSIDSKVPMKFLKSKVTLKLSPLTLENFDGELNIKSDDINGKLVGKLSWKKSDNGFQSSFSLQTPVESVKDIKASFSYAGNIKAFSSALEMSANKLGRINCNIGMIMDGEKQLNIIVNKFSGSGRYRRATNKLFSLFVNSQRSKFVAKVELPTCKAVKKINFEVNRNLNAADCTLTWDTNRVSLKFIRPVQSKYQVSLETTFDKLKKATVEIVNSITDKRSEHSIKVTHEKGTTFAEVIVEKEKGKSIKVNGKVENTLIPKVPNMSFTLDHQGMNPKKFTNKLVLKVREKEGSAITTFNILDKKEGSIEIITPFVMFENTKASFSLTGGEKTIFSSAVKTGFGTGELEIILSQGKLTASFNFNNMIYGEAVFNGSLKSFTSSLQIMEGSKRVRRATASPLMFISLTFKVDRSSVNTSLDLKSKYLPVDHQTIGFQFAMNGDFELPQFQGSFKKFFLRASAFTSTRTYTTELNWDITSKKTASIKVRYPFTNGCMISSKAFFTTENGLKLTGNVDKCGEKLFNLDLTSNLLNKLDAIVKSSIDFINSEVHYNHGVNSKQVSGSLLFKNRKLGEYNGRFSASWKTDIDATLKLQMPENEEMTLTLRQSGKPDDMKIEITAASPKLKTVNMKFTFSLKNPITIKLEIDTPFTMMKRLEINFNFEKAQKKFSTKLEFKHNKLGDYSTSLSYDGSRSAYIIFTLQTPVKVVRNVKFTFSYAGKIMEKFDQAMYATWNGKTIGYSATIQISILKYRIEIDTPFKGFEKIIISNMHEGDKTKFSHAVKVNYGQGREIHFQINHDKTEGGYKGDLRFRSPFKNFEDISLLISHMRDGQRKWRMDHQLRYASGKVIRAYGFLDHSLPKISARVTIETPFVVVKEIKFISEHNHRSALDFDFIHRLTIDEKVCLLKGRLNKNNEKIVGSILIDTPFKDLSNFDANFRHIGGFRKFENVATVTYGIARSISTKVKFDITMKNAVEALMHIDTPWKGLKFGKIILKHTGTLRQHNQHFEAGINGKAIVYSGKVSLNDPMDMSTEHSLKTPFARLQSVKVQFDHKNGIAHLNLAWNKLNFVKVVGLLNRNNIFLAELTVTSSFHNLKKSFVSLKHAGKKGKFNAEGLLDVNGVKSKLQMSYENSLPELSLKTSTSHGVKYDLNVGVQKTGDEYQGKLRIARDSTELLKVKGNLKFDFQKPQKMLNIKLHGVLPIRGANEISIEFSFSGNKEAFMALGKGSFFKKHVITTTLNYGTYKRILAQVTYNGIPYSIGYIYGKSADMKDGMNLAVELTLNQQKAGLSLDFGSDQIELDIRTPFKEAKEIFFFLSHKQMTKIDFVHRSLFRLNKHRYFNLDLTVDTKNGVISMKAPTVFTIKYSLVGTRYIRAELQIDPDKTDSTKRITIQAFVQLDNDDSKNKTSHEGYLSLKTKYRFFVLETKTTMAPASFFHKIVLRPDGNRSKPWKIHLSTLRHIAGHNRQRTDEWIVSTPVREMRVHMETELKEGKFTNDLDFYWDNARVTKKKMGWKLKMEQSGNDYDCLIKFHHPKMSEGVSLLSKSTVNSGDSILRSRTIFRYTDNPREAIEIALKLSRAGQRMLRGSASVRQEATQLNTKLSGSFGGNRGVYINGLTLSHLMNGKTRIFQVLSHVNVVKRSFMMELVTPVRTYSWMSVAALTSDGVKITYQLSYDKSKKANGQVTLSRSPSFKTRLYFSPGNADNYVEAYGRFVNKKHIEVQIHRMTSNRRYSDFLFRLKLQGEHLLKSRLFWRPTLFSEAQTYFTWRVQEFKKSAKLLWPQFVSSLRKELNMKKNLIIATIPNFDAFRDYTNKEIVLIKEDLYRLGGMLYDSYMADDFWLYSFSRLLYAFAQKVNEKAKVMKVSLHWTMMQGDPLFRPFKQMIRRTLDRLSQTSEVMSKSFGGVSRLGRHHINRSVEKLTPFVKSMHQRYAAMEERGFQMVQTAVNSAHHHYIRVVRPRIDSAQAWAASGLRSLSNYHRDSRESILKHFHRDLRKKIMQVHATIQRSIDTLSHRYGILFHSLRTRMNRQFNQSFDFTTARYASNVIKAGIKKFQWAYNQLDVEQKLKDFGHAQYLQAIEYMRENSIDVIRDYLRLEQSRLTTFDPENGRIEGQIYIPFSMRDLQSRPDFSSLPRTARKIQRTFLRPKVSPVPSLRWVKEAVLKRIPNLEKNPRAWLPTFRGYASIAGKHIVTFDKVHYDLDGNCDYVLSRDYKGQRWAVILNQAKKARYISFRAYEKEFAIHQDHSVTVDGEKVELPFVYRNLSILRFGPIIKAKDTLLGFSVTSDVVNDMHTLGVNGWYHGKLGGLFGNFDNEPFNDMQTVDHRLTEKADVFIQSWALRGCQHNTQVGRQSRPSKLAKKACKFLFECPLSPLAKCFRHINTKPFLKMCMEDVDEQETGGRKSSVCRAAILYAQHCRMAHVRVRIPRPCRKCLVPSPQTNEIKEDHTITLNNNKATADVVFVVEEAPCNREVVPRLTEIVRRLELAFRRGGFTDNRYGLVGFGRKVHGLRYCTTHSHTVNSQLMGESENFMRALNNFEFNNITTGRPADPLRAIRKASSYPLRPGSARHVIVVPCSACEERRTSFGEVEDALKDQDILLYTLMDHQIRLRRPSMSPQSNYMFGLDKRVVFTQRDIEKVRGDRRLFRQVIRPLDMCSQLSYATGGAVFNSQKLINMHVASQGWFAQVFANRVATSSTSPRTLECTCTFNRWDRPNLACKKTGTLVMQYNPNDRPVLPIAIPESSSDDLKLAYRR